MSRIIAIDYGSRRVGLAVTDPQQIIATALATIPSHELMHYLDDYIRREGVEAFVVGESENDDGSSNHATSIIRDFVKGLKKRFPEIPVYMEDESFTSQNALQAMIQSGIGRNKRRDKGLVDRISAVLILQAFLERKQHNL